MDKFYVWEIFSHAWSEIGIEDDECKALLIKGCINAQDIPEIERIYYRDICASFAVDSFLIFPMMLWMLMPDWGFNEKYLRARMIQWYARPYWVNFINPLRFLGYPIAIGFSFKYKRMVTRLLRENA